MVRLRRYSNWALKGLDRALPLSMAVPEVITFCTEEIRLSSSPSPSSYISPYAVRKNSLVVNVCYFRRHSVLLADVPNA